MLIKCTFSSLINYIASQTSIYTILSARWHTLFWFQYNCEHGEPEYGENSLFQEKQVDGSKL